MEDILGRFLELQTARCNRISLVNFGEDSVRYDFFVAVSEVKNIKPWEIQVESAIHEDAYIRRQPKRKFNEPSLESQTSKRNEKPLMDLIVDTASIKFCAEFALFRQDGNEKGNINKTARVVKMINDMIRLGNESYHTKRSAYFICVADSKMLGHRLRSRILNRFPSDYEITLDIITQQKESKTSNFDDRFINRFKALNVRYNAKIIFNKEIKANLVTKETRIIAWEISCLHS